MRRALAFLIPGSLLALSPAPLSGADAKGARQPPWATVVVLGASSSSGFGTGKEVGPEAADVRLAEVVDKMLRLKHRKVEDLAEGDFFMKPEETAKKLLGKAKEVKPTTVIALDFLFWFGYGKLAGRKERLASLEKGMKLLEELECPVVVSLFPDMRPAIGQMLAPEQVPDAETLKALNDRLTRWAKGRKNVIVAPLAESLDKLRAGQPVKAGKSTWLKGSLPRLLQKDQLHPTIEGLAFMAALGLDALRLKNLGTVPDSALDLNAPAVAKGLIEEKKKAR